MSPAKTTEPIEMPFGADSCGSEEPLLDGVKIGRIYSQRTFFWYDLFKTSKVLVFIGPTYTRRRQNSRNEAPRSKVEDAHRLHTRFVRHKTENRSVCPANRSTDQPLLVSSQVEVQPLNYFSGTLSPIRHILCQFVDFEV